MPRTSKEVTKQRHWSEVHKSAEGQCESRVVLCFNSEYSLCRCVMDFLNTNVLRVCRIRSVGLGYC